MELLWFVVLLPVALLLPLPIAIRRLYRAPRLPHATTPRQQGLPGRKIWLRAINAKRLCAWHVPPPAGRQQPAPAVVILHGWGGNSAQMLPFARLLHRAGYAVLLLDARNHGCSEQDSHASLPRFAEDLESGLEWLLSHPEIDPTRVTVLGHSVGGAAALLLASRRHEIAAVVSIAAFAHPRALLRRQMAAHHIPWFPVGWLVARYIQHVIGHRFDDIAPCNTIHRVQAPVLLVHGLADRFVPLEDAERIHANRPDDRVELLRLPGVGHDSVEAIATHGERLLEFLERAGAGSGKPAVAEPPEASVPAARTA